MNGHGAKVDFTAYRHPVFAVPCPDCDARAGVGCRRPSGHNVWGEAHAARKQLADRVHEDQGDPPILNTTGGRRAIGLGIWRYQEST